MCGVKVRLIGIIVVTNQPMLDSPWRRASSGSWDEECRGFTAYVHALAIKLGMNIKHFQKGSSNEYH